MITYNNVKASKLKTKTYHYYHAFTDNKDVNFNVVNQEGGEALRLAKEKIKEWKSSGETRLRIYEVIEIESHIDDSIDLVKEDCVFSEGEYPY